MNIDGLVFTLLIGAAILGAIAVVIDRLNFPQRPFRAKQIVPTDEGPSRDRTGAHVLTEVDPTAQTSDADKNTDQDADKGTDKNTDKDTDNDAGRDT